jgi:signal transduction histidine kinase
MSFPRYLKDNVRYVLLYFLLAVFLAAMALLDGQGRMEPGNAAYAAAVSFIVYVAGVLIDYSVRRRQAARLQELVRASDKTPVLPEPADYRDELYAELVAGLYAEYTTSTGRLEEDFRDSKDFMAAWAHEVKTPITAARLLLEGPVGEAEAESLREEIERINSSVEKVLYHSRSDSFTRDYIIAEVPLERLVKENVKKHSALFIRKHIGIQIDVPDGLAVDSDRKWLLFILDQLLSNALKYTGEGGHIAITARQDEKETVLTYRDDGIGIKAEDIGRLFTKSFTGRNGRAEESSATGLGLYLAQKLARKLGHSITISSTFGSGTAAEIHFPVLNDFYLTKL